MTITVEPQNFTTASNPVVFEFSSILTGQPGFSFLIELTVNGSVHSYHQVFPEQSNYGKFDCSEILRSIVKSELISDGSFATPYTNAVASYSIRVRPKYGTPPTEQGVYVSSNTLNVINGSLRHIDWISYVFGDYDFAVSSPCLYLTNFPRTQQYFCGLTESMFLAMVNSSAVAVDLTAKLYTITDTLIATGTASALSSANLLLVNVSPSSVVANTSVTDGNFTTCSYYTIQLSHSGANTEEFKIYIDNECNQYTSRRLHWLNKFGVWDSFSFTKYSEESTKTRFFEYERDPGQWSSSNTFDYDRVNGSVMSGTKTSKDTMKLNSNWIKEEVQNWLMPSLLESPSVYLEITEGVFEPVIVSNKALVKKQKIKEGLIQQEIRIKRTYNYTSQLN